LNALRGPAHFMETINTLNYIAVACAFALGVLLGWLIYASVKDILK